MEGLGCAVELQDGIGHNFEEYVFVHNTSLCIGVDEAGLVCTNDKVDNGYDFAWGGSSPDI